MRTATAIPALFLVAALGVSVKALFSGGPDGRATAPPRVEAAEGERGRALLSASVRADPVATDEEGSRVPVDSGESPTAFVRHTPDAIALWIADLRHDDVEWNAIAAHRRLRSAGPEADAALYEALDSDDRQQRQFAADLLRERGAPDTERLIEVTVEGLRHDRLPDDGQGGNCPSLANAQSGLRWLSSRTGAALPHLLRGLGSTDGQERFLCATLIAYGGHTEQIGVVTDELIAHVGSNDVPGDGLLAAHALWRLGEPALPFVRASMRWTDDQGYDLLRRIEWDITDPPRTHADFEARMRDRRFSRVYRDPVVELRIDRFEIRWQDEMSRVAGLPPR